MKKTWRTNDEKMKKQMKKKWRFLGNTKSRKNEKPWVFFIFLHFGKTLISFWFFQNWSSLCSLWLSSFNLSTSSFSKARCKSPSACCSSIGPGWGPSVRFTFPKACSSGQPLDPSSSGWPCYASLVGSFHPTFRSTKLLILFWPRWFSTSCTSMRRRLILNWSLKLQALFSVIIAACTNSDQ